MFNGNRFRLSPDHTFSAGMTLAAEVPGGRIDFTPAVTYESKVFFDNDNDRPDLQTIAAGKIVPDTVQDEFQDGFALVSARLATISPAPVCGSKGSSSIIGMATFIPGEPRTYGVQLTARF